MSKGQPMRETADRVVAVVSAIPPGRVMTYGDVAKAAGTGARAVGQILHRGPHDVPWWRVVDASGRPFPAAAADVLARFAEESTPTITDREGDVRADVARATW